MIMQIILKSINQFEENSQALMSMLNREIIKLIKLLISIESLRDVVYVRQQISTRNSYSRGSV